MTPFGIATSPRPPPARFEDPCMSNTNLNAAFSNIAPKGNVQKKSIRDCSWIVKSISNLTKILRDDHLDADLLQLLESSILDLTESLTFCAKMANTQERDLTARDELERSVAASAQAAEVTALTTKLQHFWSRNAVMKELVRESSLYTSAKTFEELSISKALLKGLQSELKFEKPSRIQAECLPFILNPPCANLVAQAHSGSGKTTCFVLGMLSRVDPSHDAPQALCICPTSSLALETEAVLLTMAKHTGITSVVAIPNKAVDNNRSTGLGAVHTQVVIGTPGTIKRWIKIDKILKLETVKIMVFDEVDYMLDVAGFVEDHSLKILEEIKESSCKCQILVFSTTVNEKVQHFVAENIPNANKVFLEP